MQQIIFSIVAFGGFAAILCAGGFAVWQGWRFSSVMRQKYPAKWAETTSLWGIPGMNNPFRSLPWLFGPDDCGDEDIRRRKKNARWTMLICVLVVALAQGVMIMTVVLLAVVGAFLRNG